jgi:ABC-2 type transport system permease protein
MARTAEAAPGAIYDIGYRRYDGARLGRGYAFRTLYAHSLRTAFGLGRGGRALIAPWALFAIINFPAAVTVMAAALTGGMAQLLDYPRYFDFVGTMLALFCAAQAPELVSTDQQHRVLPLYFSRALRKHDYALARLLAMCTAVFILVLTPLLVILAGRLGMAADFAAAVRTEAPRFLPILATPLVAAAVLGPLSLALASLTPRRGIGSALVLGAILLAAALSAILVTGLEGDTGRWGVLLNPVLTAHGAILALFDAAPGGGDMILSRAALPKWAFGAGAAAYATLFTALLLGRYARMRT